MTLKADTTLWTGYIQPIKIKIISCFRFNNLNIFCLLVYYYNLQVPMNWFNYFILFSLIMEIQQWLVHSIIDNRSQRWWLSICMKGVRGYDYEILFFYATAKTFNVFLKISKLMCLGVNKTFCRYVLKSLSSFSFSAWVHTKIDGNYKFLNHFTVNGK